MKQVRRAIFLLFVLAITFEIIASSSWTEKMESKKSKGSIEGTIIDETTGELLTGVSVYIDNELQGYTNFDGEFLITEVSPGSHTLTTSMISYNDYKKEVICNDQTTIKIDLKIME